MKSIRILALATAVLGGLSLGGTARADDLGIGQQGLINQGEQLNVPYRNTGEDNMVGGGRVVVLYQGSRDTVIKHLDSGFTERAPGIPVDAGGRTGEVVYLEPGDPDSLMLLASRLGSATSIAR